LQNANNSVRKRKQYSRKPWKLAARMRNVLEASYGLKEWRLKIFIFEPVEISVKGILSCHISYVAGEKIIQIHGPIPVHEVSHESGTHLVHLGLRSMDQYDFVR
jgi:hypothetical protein